MTVTAGVAGVQAGETLVAENRGHGPLADPHYHIFANELADALKLKIQ